MDWFANRMAPLSLERIVLGAVEEHTSCIFCEREMDFNAFLFLSALGKTSKKRYWDFLGILLKPMDPPTPSLGSFRNTNVTFGQKNSGFQGQK